MNKQQEYWIKAWQEGHTSFHKNKVNPDLIQYLPSLDLPANTTILLPLCGKSLDLFWLSQQGFKVIGIELTECAVDQFAKEHQLNFHQKTIGNVKCFFNDLISIWVADIFSLNASLIEPVDAIYDRAALIALPENLRKSYVEICLHWLKPNGLILLKTLNYNQIEFQGPPFSVTDEEVTFLFEEGNSIIRLGGSLHQVDPLSTGKFIKVRNSIWGITKKG